MAYKTQSPDTSPEMEKIYFDLLRQKPRAERIKMAFDFSDQAVARARARIARKNPDWSRQDVALHWAELMYGEELAARLRKHLQQG